MKKLVKKFDDILDKVTSCAGEIIQFILGLQFGIFLGITMMLILTKIVTPLVGIILFIIITIIIEALTTWAFKSLDKAYDEEIKELEEVIGSKE